MEIPNAESEYKNLRVLVIRENWLGNTGLSAFGALLRTGAWAFSLTESEYVPLEWRALPAKTVARVLRPAAVGEFNRALERTAEEMRPHLFLAFKGAFVKPEALRRLHRMGVVRYCFFPDTAIANSRYLPHAIREYDWIFTTKSFGPRDFREQFGIQNCSFLPHAFDPIVHHPRTPTAEEDKMFGCDVSFIGSWSPKKQKLLEDLVHLRPGLSLKVWGNSWQNLPRSSPLRPYAQFQPVVGIGYATAISCSKINLGLLREGLPGASSGDLITSRTFHIPACGGLLLHERTTDVLQIFEENESCVCFEGAHELASKIDEFLKDRERCRAVAARGRGVVLAAHSWDHRVSTILDKFAKQRVA